MNILYVTHNSSLRSTTCVLDALFSNKETYNINPVVAFNSEGPWKEKLKSDGIRVYDANFDTIQLTSPFRSIKTTLVWLRILRKENIELVHVNEHDNFPSIKLAAYILRIPVVVGVRFVLGDGFGQWAFGGKMGPKALMFTSEDQLLKSKHDIPEVSPPIRVSVVGNGRDLDGLTAPKNQRNYFRTSFNVPDEAIFLGTASVIRRRKRLEDFIELVVALKQTGKSAYGIILGGGKFGEQAYFDELKAKISSLGMDDFIFMPGNTDDVTPFYQAIDLFVSTSELETFGMSVCEAMAFEKPVFGYAGGSVKEVLSDERGIIDECNKELLIQRVLEFIDQPVVLRDMAEKGKERAFREFNAKQLAEKINNIYQAVMS